MFGKKCFILKCTLFLFQNGVRPLLFGHPVKVESYDSSRILLGTGGCIYPESPSRSEKDCPGNSHWIRHRIISL